MTNTTSDETTIVPPSGPAAYEATAREIVAGLDVDTKVRMLSGATMWSTEAVEGAPSVLLANGPNGVGKQQEDGDHIGVGKTVPATAFPAGAALGATWDPELLEEMGRAMGREARAEGVGVLLGPGLNIKRHPGGGRVFEYYSEDPLIAGKTAAALVRGLQSEGVGASVKHLAANNQETFRMRLDSVVDERTLREIYLAGFEIAVREGRPWTVMTSYNKLNGEHTGESSWLVRDLLRGEWGFDGLVMSDWMAVFDRIEGVRAGLDLEMPGGSAAWDDRLRAAVTSGELSMDDVDAAAVRLVILSLRAMDAAPVAGTVDRDAHHELARRTAAAGTVLLTNDGLLPLGSSGSFALIGAAAETPRFQGAGSSQVNAWKVDTVADALRARLGEDAEVQYAPGYDLKTGDSSPELLADAATAASAADVAVLVLAIPSGTEAEGVDRNDLTLPPGFASLVSVVVAANPRTVVVLVNGAPVEIPWAERPAALVEAYLGGQASGGAIVDVLFGDAEPGGRLAESFPMRAADLAASAHFPTTTPTQVQYRETSYVGYRFHDSWDVAPRFPFGHGLGYTTFSYGEPVVSGTGTDLVVRLPVTNTGDRAGTEVVQLYVHDVESSVHRPEQELRAFARVHVAAGETVEVELALTDRAFAVYDVASSRWAVESGVFELRIGASSRDIRHRVSVTIDSDDVVTPVAAPARAIATDAEFARLLGGAIPTARPLLPFTTDSTVDDLKITWLGRRIRGVLLSGVRKQFAGGGDEDLDRMIAAVVAQMPLRGLIAAAGGKLSLNTLDRIVGILNAASPAAQRAAARAKR